MQYHIQTMPIWEVFKSPCTCPMCELEKRVNDRLIKQYTDEAVMLPEFRIKVNKYGFCAIHSKKLFNGGNKCGVALQFLTRTEYLENKLPYIEKVKKAKGASIDLKSELNSCIICQTLDESMERYAYTIAQMYSNEKEFPPLFEKSNGFCMPHYILLLENAHKSGKLGDLYIKSLTLAQKRGLTKCQQELEKFISKFDYRSTTKNLSSGNDALEIDIKKLHGEVL